MEVGKTFSGAAGRRVFNSCAWNKLILTFKGYLFENDNFYIHFHELMKFIYENNGTVQCFTDYQACVSPCPSIIEQQIKFYKIKKFLFNVINHHAAAIMSGKAIIIFLNKIKKF